MKVARIVGLLVTCLAWTARGEVLLTVDFGRSEGPALSKEVFGVYQTPLVSAERLVGSLPLLREAGIRDFRYEVGWGKPDVLAPGQVRGDAEHPQIDFAALDPLRLGLRAAGVRPLLALGYCPDPLKSRKGWEAWKDLPKDLGTWRMVCREFAAHWRAPAGSPPMAYEVWNEPDMPEGQGKMFFAGTAADYGALYTATLAGVRAGDQGALVGRPAAAYDLDYLAPLLAQPAGDDQAGRAVPASEGGKGLLTSEERVTATGTVSLQAEPLRPGPRRLMNFASIHAYANYREQLANLRRRLGEHVEMPIYLSEYASFFTAEMPPNGPQSRFPAAARFFRDVVGLLAEERLAKVYWAQWLDAGDRPGIGLVTFDGHRKAIFNAFRIYGELPERRVAVEPAEGMEGVHIIAAAEQRRAGIVVWNEGDGESAVKVELAGGWPTVKGTLETLRIDAHHGSYVDDPAEETLRASASVEVAGGEKTAWQGTIPANGVVYLRWQEHP